MQITSHTSLNHDNRKKGATINWIIIHYTALPDTKTSLEWLCSTEKAVSAHYLICRTGAIFQLVPDTKRAWHAGVSRWKGEDNLNHTSLGIELDNDGFEPYAQEQIESLMLLLNNLCIRHSIPKTHILGHNDIAPDRKIDPGPHFPWHILYDHGFALARLA
ncbi:MAG: N-acetylmuramoyl-L-alanine amidase [Alphaproteobacteria bacterium]|nr:N-acetylmuramoyl-L-alanine amidase [Alphaproteobacteria bacterium]